MNFRCTIFWTAGVLGALARIASAASVTLSPTQDAFVSSANSTSNYGKAGALLVNAAGLPKGEFDSLLEFNFSSAKSSFDTTFGTGQWTITSIALQLTSASPNSSLFNSPAAAGQFTFKWMQNDSWVEGTGTPAAPTTTGITFGTLPSFLSGSDETLGTYSFAGGTSGNNTYTLGLTTNFLADATGGNTVSLLALPADSGIVYTANSQDFTTSSSRPVLTVTAQSVPEPGTAVLLAGSVWLGLLRRRRHVFA
jgi:hypothetical protein